VTGSRAPPFLPIRWAHAFDYTFALRLHGP
jgi:hypothetical protein